MISTEYDRGELPQIYVGDCFHFQTLSAEENSLKIT